MMHIYVITNAVNGKVYVGLTTRAVKKRFSEHLREAARGNDQLLLYRAMRKHGKDNFSFEHIFSTKTRDDLLFMETYFIQELRASLPEYGYNCNLGGHHPVHNEETRKKMSERKKGVKLNEEHRKKLSEIRRGKKHSPEVREQERLRLTVRNKSVEHREKVSRTKTGTKRPPYSETWCENLKQAHIARRRQQSPDSHGYVYLAKRNVRGKTYEYWTARVKIQGKTHSRVFSTKEEAEEGRKNLSLALYHPTS